MEPEGFDKMNPADKADWYMENLCGNIELGVVREALEQYFANDGDG